MIRTLDKVPGKLNSKWLAYYTKKKRKLFRYVQSKRKKNQCSSCMLKMAKYCVPQVVVKNKT